jgi:hypothetical protein
MPKKSAGVFSNEDTPSFFMPFFRVHIKTNGGNQNGKRNNAYLFPSEDFQLSSV